jgi:hypothetical protein
MNHVGDTRTCEQCGAAFTPRREHARFCSCSCRIAWNSEREGDLVAEASALDWTIAAMCDVTEWLGRVGTRDRSQAFTVVGEAVWWVTIVDATLIRYHLEAYESVTAAQAPAERRLIEGTLGGLRFVRNRMGYYLDHADFIEPQPGPCGTADGRITTWSWRSLPEPALGSLPPRGQEWEMERYRAYEAQLAGHCLGEVFGRAATFLKLAAAQAARGGAADAAGTRAALTRGA